ncbi:MAG TPA: zf-TFIIB domain-containing protein [Vicinamibacterales bacterium]
MANCVNCGAPMWADKARGGLVCTHCGSVEALSPLIREIEIGDATEAPCPVCSAPLANARLDGNPLLVCPQCAGMLIAMPHFVSVINAARAHEDQHGVVLPRTQKPGDRTLTCPRCHQSMLSHFYGGPGNLVIDSCERCQVNWLDPGELRRIARA